MFLWPRQTLVRSSSTFSPSATLCGGSCVVRSGGEHQEMGLEKNCWCSWVVEGFLASRNIFTFNVWCLLTTGSAFMVASGTTRERERWQWMYGSRAALWFHSSCASGVLSEVLLFSSQLRRRLLEEITAHFQIAVHWLKVGWKAEWAAVDHSANKFVFLHG